MLFRCAIPFLALMMLFPAPTTAERIKPEAEVKSFTFRKFNDRGLRLWDLSGKEAVFLSDNIIRVIEMQLSVTSTRGTGETLLRSPTASIFVEDNSATGEGFVFVQGSGFSMEGKDWEWRGAERKIEVRRGAKVTFDEAIRRVLK